MALITIHKRINLPEDLHAPGYSRRSNGSVRSFKRFVLLTNELPPPLPLPRLVLASVLWEQPTLTDVTLVTSEADLPEDLHAPGLKLFVCSTDAKLQRRVVNACDTLTTSLGPVSGATYHHIISYHAIHLLTLYYNLLYTNIVVHKSM